MHSADQTFCKSLTKTSTPNPGEVQADIRATGLNRAELLFFGGQYLVQPKLPGAGVGVEGAGFVKAVGEGVDSVRVGDRVAILPALSMDEDASADPEFSSELETALLADLRGISVQGAFGSINLALREANGALVAGLSAALSYGWIRVNMLWVSQGLRRTGVGKDLMQQAIDLGKSQGCHSSWLETSNPAARLFYESLGFDVFAKLANNGLTPAEHTRWFLRRTLVAGRTNEDAL